LPDGLTGFKDAIHAVFPKARIQRCILHQIRNSLKYVSYTEQDDFMRDLSHRDACGKASLPSYHT
jgi:transposase-like protein